jgi:hypothetical protein
MILFWGTIGAQLGPRFNPSPNKPYFGNLTILMSLIKAFSCPDLTSNRHLFIPGKRGRKKAITGRLWALYGAQFGRIFSNKSIYCPYFHANQNGRFYGRILGVASLPREGAKDETVTAPIFTHTPDLPAFPEENPEKSGS